MSISATSTVQTCTMAHCILQQIFRGETLATCAKLDRLGILTTSITPETSTARPAWKIYSNLVKSLCFWPTRHV